MLKKSGSAGGAPPASYFLNFSGLDRYNRSGVKFVFDPAKRELHYDGAAWREIVRRHPQSAEAAEARASRGAAAEVSRKRITAARNGCGTPTTG